MRVAAEIRRLPFLCDRHHGSQLNVLVLVLQVEAYQRLIAGISAVTQAFHSVNADQDFVFGVRFVRGEKIAQSRSGFGGIDSLQGTNSMKDSKSIFAARDRHRYVLKIFRRGGAQNIECGMKLKFVEVPHIPGVTSGSLTLLKEEDRMSNRK